MVVLAAQHYLPLKSSPRGQGKVVSQAMSSDLEGDQDASGCGSFVQSLLEKFSSESMLGFANIT